MAIWILAPDPVGVCCDCTGKTSPCDPCAPSVCSCALLTPIVGGSPPFATITDARADIASFVTNCLYWNYAVAPSTNTFTLTNTYLKYDSSLLGASGGGLATELAFSASLKAGNISFAYTLHNGLPNPIPSNNKITSINIDIHDCSGALITSLAFNDSSHSSDFTGTLNYTLGSDNEYIFVMVISFSEGGGNTAGNCSSSLIITPTTLININPVIAIWSDGGTPRRLEACPRLYIPLNTLPYYSTLSDAQNAITNQTSNCIGYIYSDPSYITPTTLSITATNAGSTLVLSGNEAVSSSLFNSSFGFIKAGAINLVGGSTITLSLNFSGSDTTGTTIQYNASYIIYDNTETFVSGSNFPSSGTITYGYSNSITSSAIPFTGNFTIYIYIANNTIMPSSTTANITATTTIISSSTLSANTIAARYINSTTCPSVLQCAP